METQENIITSKIRGEVGIFIFTSTSVFFHIDQYNALSYF
jgi:hypothetical protein